jgi:GNAT superfamily N-acetyltransferase
MTALTLRVAQADDVPTLNALIQLSAQQLSAGFYQAPQIAALNRYVFGVDTTLIADGSYFVIMFDGVLAACGGWSQRRTLYGGDQRRVGLPEKLTPPQDAAKIRAFFVHPQFARRGIGRYLLQHCEQCASAHGFIRAELMATLPGVPLYSNCGYQAEQKIIDRLPDGTDVEFVRMSKSLS